MAKMPIRNKSKDNPYTLGFDEEKQTYTVEFVDNKKVIHKVEISDKVYEAFNKIPVYEVSEWTPEKIKNGETKKAYNCAKDNKNILHKVEISEKFIKHLISLNLKIFHKYIRSEVILSILNYVMKH